MGRIANIPSRDWKVGAEQLAEVVSDWLRTPYGTRRFRPAQAVALVELPQVDGLFCGMSVGAGKTDIAACAPTVVDAKRPLLVVPGKLKSSGKTKRELDALRSQWRMVPHIPIETYNRLALAPQVDFFKIYRPDLVIFDESQKLKDSANAVASRAIRYWGEVGRENVKFVFLSGSPTLNGIKDFWHLFEMAFGPGNPLPRIKDLAEAWGAVVDAVPADQCDLEPIIAELGPCETIGEARKLVCDRILSTPGVIITQEPFPGPIRLEVLRHELPDNLQELYPKLRLDWEAADGFPLTDAKTEVYAHAMRYAVGLEHYWDPWPPREWREARKKYGQFVRRNLGRNNWDTELQIREAIETGVLESEEYWVWKAIEPTWHADPKKRMVSDVAAEVAGKWLGADKGGIIWVRHTELGEYLERTLGLPYFGQSGLNSKRQAVDTYFGGNIIASVAACGEGFNLQGPLPTRPHFWRCLYLEHANSAQLTEQSAGRIHRPEQTFPVEVQFYFACLEHYYTLDSQINKARYANEILRLPQKLLTHPILRAPDHGTPAWKTRDQLQEERDQENE